MHVYDYKELLVVAVNFLRISPSEFWKLIPEEYTALVTHKLKMEGVGGVDYLDKNDIDDLLEMHPDGKEYKIITKEILKKELKNGCSR